MKKVSRKRGIFFPRFLMEHYGASRAIFFKEIRIFYFL